MKVARKRKVKCLNCGKVLPSNRCRMCSDRCQEHWQHSHGIVYEYNGGSRGKEDTHRN